MIRDAVEADEKWVKRVFTASDHILGKGFFGTIWYRFWQNYRVHRGASERWVVIEEKAFAHFKQRRDGVKVLYEIATDEAARRQGHARALVAYIGFPMELKTDSNHQESNTFYQALGFYPCGEKRSRDGMKKMRIYRCAP